MNTRLVNLLVKAIQETECTYDGFNQAAKIARDRCQLKPGRKARADKQLPTQEELHKFFLTVQKANAKDALMIKLMFFMGLRVAEVANLRWENVDLDPGRERAYVERKAGLHRSFNIPGEIGQLLRLYKQTVKDGAIYVFESKFHKQYDTRSIRKKFQQYRKNAGVGDTIHPHAMRHLILTYLANQGWSAHDLQLVSGHASVTSLDHYVNRNPEMIRNKQNKALGAIGGAL